MPLFGKAGVVNDPGLDRSGARHLRQYHLAHLGQNSIVRPSSLTDKMQQLIDAGPRFALAP